MVIDESIVANNKKLGQYYENLEGAAADLQAIIDASSEPFKSQLGSVLEQHQVLMSNFADSFKEYMEGVAYSEGLKAMEDPNFMFKRRRFPDDATKIARDRFLSWISVGVPNSLDYIKNSMEDRVQGAIGAYLQKHPERADEDQYYQ